MDGEEGEDEDEDDEDTDSDDLRYIETAGPIII